ncbi:hypothetical protein [Pedobacter sp. R-06]|uniref:hypothetical protein n=1 Tax=Pedobacter sp. R-06 TaxID=3404051 RepID=UPI003CFABD4B
MVNKFFIIHHYNDDAAFEYIICLHHLGKLSQRTGNMGDNFCKGEVVAIMPNVTIAKNSIFGANGVVTKSFPPNSIFEGFPTSLFKKRRVI